MNARITHGALISFTVAVNLCEATQTFRCCRHYRCPGVDVTAIESLTSRQLVIRLEVVVQAAEEV